jgi:hypothetical protein
VSNGGNSHQRKKERRAHNRLAGEIKNDVVQQIRNEGLPISKPTFWNKAGTFWASSPLWGAVGMLIALLFARVSVVILYVLTGVVLVGEFIRVGFFTQFRWKIIGNFVVAVCITGGLYYLWKKIPPKEPTTLDQTLEAMAKRFPGLTQPRREEPKVTTAPAPVIVSEMPKLKLSLTEGKQYDRTLILDNSKGSADLSNFEIVGLGYYLNRRNAVDGIATIQDKYELPSPLNFAPFTVKAGEVKKIDLSGGRYGIAIHMHDVSDNQGRSFDALWHFICLQIKFINNANSETFIHYQVMSPYGDLWQIVEHPEYQSSGGLLPHNNKNFALSVIRVIKEDARQYYGTEYREYQP